LAAQGKLPHYPPFPEHYFDTVAQALLREYEAKLRRGESVPYPEALLVPHLDNTWHDTAEAVVGNWIGCVYQVTHSERKRPFMDGVDPANPLGIYG
jgi:homoserine O-succinyltransferase